MNVSVEIKLLFKELENCKSIKDLEVCMINFGSVEEFMFDNEIAEFDKMYQNKRADLL